MDAETLVSSNMVHEIAAVFSMNTKTSDSYIMLPKESKYKQDLVFIVKLQFN